VRGKDGVDERGFSKTRLACIDEVSSMLMLMLISRSILGCIARHVPTHITLNWKPRFKSFRSIWEVMLSKPTWLRGKTTVWGTAAAIVAVADGGLVAVEWGADRCRSFLATKSTDGGC
jgi:hypothetical protein